MKKTNLLLVILAGLGIVSCNTDNEFSQLNSGIVGSPNYTTESTDIPLEISNIKNNSVQTNGLSAFQLGQITQGDFGTTNAKIISQVLLPSSNPTFGQMTQAKEEETGSYNENEQVKNVYLYLPFFSTATTANEITSYKLDSIFGSKSAEFQLNVDELAYNLRSVNTDFEAQLYFSDQNTPQGEVLANGVPVKISNAAIVRHQFDDPTTSEDETQQERDKLAPALRIELTNKDFFQRLLLNNEGKTELSNNAEFTKILRGIIVSTSNFSQEALALINLFNAKIEVDYTYQHKHTDGAFYTKTNSISLNLATQTTSNNSVIRSGIAINTFSHSGQSITPSQDYIYLKGGDYIAELEIPQAKIQEFASKKALINQAEIIFYVDENKSVGQIPQYVLLYNAEKGLPLADYANEAGSTSPITSIQKVRKDTNGTYYKVRLSDHLISVLKGNTSNVKLGVAVSLTNSSGAFNISKYKDATNTEKTSVAGNAQTPLSVVLYGNSGNVPEDKKTKLRVWYSVSK